MDKKKLILILAVLAIVGLVVYSLRKQGASDADEGTDDQGSDDVAVIIET